MKLLLSAYACEPEKGSEPGVGWRWALEIAKLGHDVWVLTRANNQEAIIAHFLKHPQPDNLYFLYYDLPIWARWWKKGSRGVHLYYLLWQWGAYCTAIKIHRKIKFELVHHITFGVVRHPSFMGNLNIPFIFGPVGGGERCPWKLRIGFGVKGFLMDSIRDIFNILIKFDPFMWMTFSQANKIYVKTPESKYVIPRLFWKKTTVLVEIGIDPIQLKKNNPINNKESFRILYVGRFIYLKGMYMGICAFAEVVKEHPSAQLTLVGNGPDEKRWKILANDLGISKNITWVPWVSKKNLSKLYLFHDILLFPSLHDSSGNVVLEAMAHGLPVVCLDLGGPGVIVNNSCGIKVNTNNLGQGNVINKLSNEIISIINSPSKMRDLQRGALIAVQNFSWCQSVSIIYQKINYK